MSNRYPELTETTFPDKADDLIRMSDLEINDLLLVKQYQQLYNSGDLSAAKEFLISNPQLDKKIFNAAKYNKLIDGVGAAQRFFLEVNQDMKSYFDGLKETLQNDINGFRYTGVYSATTQYSLKNIVSYMGCSYICIKASKGQTPAYNDSNSYWALIAKGIQGASGTGLAPRGAWNNSDLYYVDDLVAHKNELWQCLVENISSEPNKSNSNWLLLLTISPKEEEGYTWGQLKETVEFTWEQLKGPLGFTWRQLRGPAVGFTWAQLKGAV